MEKIILGLLDDDREYLEMLTAYIRFSEYNEKLIIKSFTKKIGLESYLESSGRIHILLANPLLLEDLARSESIRVIITFTDKGVIYGMLNYPRIMKYQPLNQLLMQLMAINSETENSKSTTKNDVSITKIVSVYSAVGGCGKTIVAANLAKLLAFRDCKVFHFSLEWVPSTSMFPAVVENHNFAQLLYYLKSNPKQVDAKLDVHKRIDPSTKVEYLEPLQHIAEIEDITAEDVSQLLQTIAAKNEYDFVVVDLDSSLQSRTVGALANSDHIVWLVTDDVLGLHKTRHVLDELKRSMLPNHPQWEQKISFLLNKYTGSITNEISTFGIDIQGNLPYVPQWKSVHSVEQLLTVNIFQGHLSQWFSAHIAPIRSATVG